MKRIIIILVSALLFIIPQYINAQRDKDSIVFCNRMEKIRASKGIVEINYDNFYGGNKYQILDNSYNRLIEFSTINSTFIIYNNKDTLSDLDYIEDYIYLFKPFYYFELEPNVIQFECTGVKDNYWEIFVDRDLDKKGYIEIDTAKFVYKDWYKYYIGAMVMTDDNSIMKIDTNDSKRVSNKDLGDEEIYVISEIKGDWAKLTCFKADFVRCSEKQLWIKWISDDKILVNLAFSM